MLVISQCWSFQAHFHINCFLCYSEGLLLYWTNCSGFKFTKFGVEYCTSWSLLVPTKNMVMRCFLNKCVEELYRLKLKLAVRVNCRAGIWTLRLCFRGGKIWFIKGKRRKWRWKIWPELFSCSRRRKSKRKRRRAEGSLLYKSSEIRHPKQGVEGVKLALISFFLFCSFSMRRCLEHSLRLCSALLLCMWVNNEVNFFSHAQ